MGSTKADVPEWAEKLAAEVAERFGLPQPPIEWAQRTERDRQGQLLKGSSGWCSPRKIRVVAGTDELDQKVTVLHELAHWVRRETHGTQDSHSAEFWRIAFDLYEAYDIPQSALWHEYQ